MTDPTVQRALDAMAASGGSQGGPHRWRVGTRRSADRTGRGWTQPLADQTDGSWCQVGCPGWVVDALAADAADPGELDAWDWLDYGQPDSWLLDGLGGRRARRKKSTHGVAGPCRTR